MSSGSVKTAARKAAKKAVPPAREEKKAVQVPPLLLVIHLGERFAPLKDGAYNAILGVKQHCLETGLPLLVFLNREPVSGRGSIHQRLACIDPTALPYPWQFNEAFSHRSEGLLDCLESVLDDAVKARVPKPKLGVVTDGWLESAVEAEDVAAALTKLEARVTMAGLVADTKRDGPPLKALARSLSMPAKGLALIEANGSRSDALTKGFQFLVGGSV